MKQQLTTNNEMYKKLRMLFILVFFATVSVNAQEFRSNSIKTPYSGNNHFKYTPHVYQKKPRGWKRIGNRRVTVEHKTNSRGAFVAVCNSDNSKNVNENFYVTFGGVGNWFSRVKFEVQKEGVAATRDGMFSDTSHLYLVSNWDNKGNEQDIIFGSGSNLRSEVKEKMRLSGVGNLGIGTSEPTERLHVKGNFRIEGFGNPETENGEPYYVLFDTKQKKNIINGATTFTDDIFVAKDFSIGKNFNFIGNFNFNDPTNTQQINVTSGLQISLKNSNTNNNFKVASTAGANAFYVGNNGKIGMGTDTPSEKLQVDGKVKASGFIADASAFPDYVFANDYELAPLNEVKKFVNTHKHLPNMPSEKEVITNGLDIKKVTTVSVEKIEELYLYTIKQQELIEKLTKRIEQLEKSQK